MTSTARPVIMTIARATRLPLAMPRPGWPKTASRAESNEAKTRFEVQARMRRLGKPEATDRSTNVRRASGGFVRVHEDAVKQEGGPR